MENWSQVKGFSGMLEAIGTDEFGQYMEWCVQQGQVTGENIAIQAGSVLGWKEGDRNYSALRNAANAYLSEHPEITMEAPEFTHRSPSASTQRTWRTRLNRGR